jgi:UV DNA damage endonuclease
MSDRHFRVVLGEGLPYVSNLALCNCRDLFRVLEWNEAAGIPFFRLCIDMFPWADQYAFEALPDFPEIRDVRTRRLC